MATLIRAAYLRNLWRRYEQRRRVEELGPFSDEAPAPCTAKRSNSLLSARFESFTESEGLLSLVIGKQVMETQIPAWTYRQVWRQYERFCRTKELDPFSDVSLAIWAYDLSVGSSDEPFLAPEFEIIEDILNVARMTG